jgi:alpha-glucosidase
MHGCRMRIIAAVFCALISTSSALAQALPPTRTRPLERPSAGPRAHANKPAEAAQRDSASARDWWKNAVIYEVYPRSFQDTNGDGIGDLNGIVEHLDYLQRVGVDGIWLTPVYPSPNVDFGYDISDYFAINPEYGTLADFDRLIAEAKKRHIRVIMDVVMNHTSSEHPWFIASRFSRENPYRDWYVWRDGKGQTATDKGQPPNNWGGFGRSSWEWDEKTREYYYHRYSVQQPDLNWYNPAVRQTFKNILRFWLKRGVAGYRFDAIGDLFEDPSYEDEAVAKDKDGNPDVDSRGNPVLERTRRFDLPAVHSVMREMHAHVHKFDTPTFPDSRVLIGETLTRTRDELIKWYGTPEQPEFDLPMDTQVGFISGLDVQAFRKKLIEAETALGNHVPLLVFDNHDRPRMDVRYGDGVHDVAIQRVLATVLVASGGATLMYYGDEIGMKTTPPARREDVKNRMGGVANWPAYRGRDGERTPMQWDASANAGFTTGSPWLTVPPSANEINVQAEERDPDSLLVWYRALIRLKKTNRALARGSNMMLDTSNDKVLSWSRQAPGAATVVVSVNFTAEQQIVNLTGEGGPRRGTLRTLLRSPGSTDSASLGRIELGPFGVFIGEVR